MYAKCCKHTNGEMREIYVSQMSKIPPPSGTQQFKSNKNLGQLCLQLDMVLIYFIYLYIILCRCIPYCRLKNCNNKTGNYEVVVKNYSIVVSDGNMIRGLEFKTKLGGWLFDACRIISVCLFHQFSIGWKWGVISVLLDGSEGISKEVTKEKGFLFLRGDWWLLIEWLGWEQFGAVA